MKSSVIDRFWSKVHKDSVSGCWIWTGAKDKGGYGQIKIDGKTVKAHRLSYENFKGSISEGMQLDHWLRNSPETRDLCSRACVNPDHLEVVTNKENSNRSFIFKESMRSNGRKNGINNGRKNGLSKRKNDLPEGLRYCDRKKRSIQAQIHCPTLKKSVYLGSRTPPTPEHIQELSEIYQEARRRLENNMDRVN